MTLMYFNEGETFSLLMINRFERFIQQSKKQYVHTQRKNYKKEISLMIRLT